MAIGKWKAISIVCVYRERVKQVKNVFKNIYSVILTQSLA